MSTSEIRMEAPHSDLASACEIHVAERRFQWGTADYCFRALHLLDSQWNVDDLRALILGTDFPAGALVHLTWFATTAPEASFLRTLAQELAPGASHTILVQPPALGANLALLAWIAGNGAEVDCKPPGITLLSQAEACFLILGDDGGGPPLSSPFDEALERFECLHASLVNSGWSFGELLRTWIGIPEINNRHHEIENYQHVNGARRDSFAKFKLTTPEIPFVNYPASTGIGTGNQSVLISGLACQPRAGTRIVYLENPNQVAPCLYEPESSLIAPLFSRAAAVVHGEQALIFVSGTASIVGTASVHPGNVVSQTRQTLDNIDALISAENLRRSGIEASSAGLSSVVCCIAYVKRREFGTTVRELCAAKLPDNTPIMIVEADVCRDALLVEIEVVALT